MITFKEIQERAEGYRNSHPDSGIAQAYRQGMVDAFRIKESTSLEGEMIVVNDSKPLPDFLTFWNAFDYKVGRLQAQRMWEKLTMVQKIEVMDAIPMYIASTTKINERGKKTRMHPATFLNPANERWKDEINIQQPLNNGIQQQLTFAEQSASVLADIIADRKRTL